MNWIQALGTIGSPIVGFLMFIVGVYQARKGHKTEEAEATNDEKKLSIHQQDANTHSFAALIDGYSDQIKIFQAQYDALEKRHNELSEKYDELNDKYEQALQHIQALEALIPNPPGAPLRPWVKA